VTEQTEVLVVGAGQAGIAMSEHLRAAGVPHLVLERDRIAERWRSERWDSLVANGPAWHDRFPGREFPIDPDAFATREQVVDYFVKYADDIDAPIRTGVEVRAVRKIHGSKHFHVETSAGPLEARYIVAATGAFQQPVIPSLVPETAGITQIHSSSYRNPQQLPAGACLSSDLDHPASRSPTNYSSPAATSISQSVRMTGRHGAIAVATSAGGSAFSVSGTRPLRRRALNMSPSRSVESVAAKPWTSGPWPRAA